MVILGIDPSLSSMGWGVIDTNPIIKYLDSGIIKTKSTELIHKRLALITSSLQKIIIQYKPNIVGMEETFVNMNNVSSLKLGYVRGATMALIGSHHDITFREFKPNMIKKALVGYGHAEKNQVLQMIKLLIPTASEVSNFDEADALAVAYTSYVHNSNS
jgi:crossover junction endodeoxyribonuclease RuvC